MRTLKEKFDKQYKDTIKRIVAEQKSASRTAIYNQCAAVTGLSVNTCIKIIKELGL